MALTKIDKPKPGDIPPPRPRLRPEIVQAMLADVEAENSRNLKIVSRQLGLKPERVLTIAARSLALDGGATIGEVLEDFIRYPNLPWQYLKLLAERDKNNV